MTILTTARQRVLSIATLLVLSAGTAQAVTTTLANQTQPCEAISQVTRTVIPLGGSGLGICGPGERAYAKTRGRTQAAAYCKTTCGSTGAKKVNKISHDILRAKSVSGGVCDIRSKIVFNCK